MAGCCTRVKVECTEATPSIDIDYWLYMMATPVQYIISPLLKKITAQTNNKLKLGKCNLHTESETLILA